MNAPVLSVLTTVFNREKYIAACIESVISSTFSDWEMIIVDDGSTDNSVEIAKRFETEDKRIKVYVNEKNLGDYPNRNKAASYAVGKYLKYLDADDIIYPHGLQVMVDAMEQFPEAGLGTQYNVREYIKPYPFLVNSEEAFQKYFFGNSYFQSGPTGTIIRRDVFEKLGGFSGKRYIGDTEMWIKISLSNPIVIFQPALIWWRNHEDQEFRSGQSIEGYIKYNHILFNELINRNDLPVSGDLLKRAKKIHASNNVRLFFAEMLKRGKIRNALRIFKVCDLSLKDLLLIINYKTWKRSW